MLHLTAATRGVGRSPARLYSTTSNKVYTDTRLLRLPDRTIAYSMYTPPSPVGSLFYLHGFPSSRLEAAELAPLALERNLQLISPDRPGFGQSSFHPYTIAAYPADLLAVADSLGIDRFSVLGASGGGPYALSAALASSRVEKVGLLASAPPWDSPAGNHMTATRRSIALLAVTPLLTPLIAAVVGAGRGAARLALVEQKIDRWLASSQPAAAEADIRKQREAVVRTLFEPFAFGARAFVHETRLLTRPWALELENISQEVAVWHAADDRAAPVAMIRPLVASLPKGKLRTFEGGHFDAGKVLGGVLDHFVP